MSSTAETKYLSLQDGKTLSRKEFNALKPKLAKLFENAQEDDLEFDSQYWVYFKGNLKINGNFFNSDKGIIVDGNLIVDGLYHDDKDNALIVLGDMQAKNVVSHYSFFVNGNLTSDGIVYANRQEYVLEVNKNINTKVLIINNRLVLSKKINADITVDSEDTSEKELIDLAMLVVPELYINAFIFNGYFPYQGDTINSYKFNQIPHEASVIQYTKNNSKILRAQPATNVSDFKSQLVTASVKATTTELINASADKNTDILALMLYASRNDLPNQAVQNLIQKKNDAVLQLLAKNPNLLNNFFNEISALSANASSSLLTHKNVTDTFIDSVVNHQNPLWRVEASRNYDLKLKPQQIEALALDSSLEVRKAFFETTKFEVNQKILDRNVSLKDESLLLNLIDNNRLNLSKSHYEQLTVNTNAKIRKAIAKNLSSDVLFLRYKNTNDSERLLFLRQLSLDTDIEVKAIALKGLTAQDQEAAVKNSPNNNQAYLLNLIAPFVKSKKLAFQIIESKDLMAIQRLALNEWTSVEVQNKIVDLYIKKYPNFNKKLNETQEEEKEDMNLVMEYLFYGRKIHASTLEKMSSYCFEHDNPPKFCKRLTRETHSRQTLQKYSSIKNADLKNHMYKELTTQPYATLDEIIKAIYSDSKEGYTIVTRLMMVSDTLFWNFLSDPIRGKPEVAAVNVHTPIETLNKLGQSLRGEFSEELLKNPVVPLDTKNKIMLKKHNFLPINGVENAFYLNVLNGKIKTSKAITEFDKEGLSRTLMDRYMADQFQ